MSDPSPTSSPRPIGPSARRASWGEPVVRLWMLFFVFAFLTFAGVCFQQVGALTRDRDLDARGISVDAVILQIEGSDVVRSRHRNNPTPVVLQYVPEGETAPRRINGTLPRGTGLLVVGQTIPIRYVPGTSLWGEGRIGGDLLSYLAPPLLLLLPVATGLIGIVLARRGVLKLAASGVARSARVESVSRSPLAPGAQLLKVALDDGSDQRLFSVIHPAKLGPIEAGAHVMLRTDAKRPGRAIVDAAYTDA